MKYKVLEGSETFERLVRLQKKIIRVNNKARAVVKQLNGSKYCKRSHVLAGGIAAIQFDSKPEGYKVVGREHEMLFYPKAKNKHDLALINKLPVIEYDELNCIVNFEAPQTYSSENGLFWINTVGISFGSSFILIDVPKECKYSPNPDIIEILESEYMELYNKLKK